MFLKNPQWLKVLLNQSNTSIDERINAINLQLVSFYQGVDPLVSIVIPVKNEEKKILYCLESIVRNKTANKCEIIIVDNNSTDSTGDIINKLETKNALQPKPGVGWARQMGLEMAEGKYVVTADADCLYHENWLEIMLENLSKENVVCVTGAYTFIGKKPGGRWKLQFYEVLRNIILKIRQKNHPYLNAWGGFMGYLKQTALEVGYDTREQRGEDGRLCFDLMAKGKIEFLGNKEKIVWTYLKSGNKGTNSSAVFSGLWREVWRSFSYFRKPKKHDTKYSANTPDSFKSIIKGIGKKDN